MMHRPSSRYRYLRSTFVINVKHTATGIGELANLAMTKIITLIEFFNFVSEVSRLQYEWSSDCWCIWKPLGVNACLQWRNVFSFHWRSALCKIFCEVIFDCACALAWSISLRRECIRALLSLPRSALRAEKFQESSLCTWWMLDCETGHVCNKLHVPFPPGHPRLGL
jgi:hypothetical protein